METWTGITKDYCNHCDKLWCRPTALFTVALAKYVDEAEARESVANIA